MSIILNSDSYKASHYKQYPPKAERVYSYVSTRGVDKALPFENPEIVHFGLQAYIQEYLSKPIRWADINEAEDILVPHGLPFNHADWRLILMDHGGYLPVTIEALPEGTVLPVGTTQVQIYNTDKRFPWLTSYLETSLLRAVWYPSTVATISREIKKIIAAGLMKTQGNLTGLGHKLHDFGGRGVSSKESAGLGGMAHLINFMGTDTLEAIRYARKYYSADMPGFSIPASEHSTITAWGRANEAAAQRNMLKQFGITHSMFASVGDSYDIYDNVERIWGEHLKDELLASKATLVIRPDSGDPLLVLPKVMDILASRFGVTFNQNGYKQLKNVSVIWGDGMNPSSIKTLISYLVSMGWCISNVAFGMGGGLLQKLDRDTFKYANKASAITIDGITDDIFKAPITDPGKSSRRGIQAVTMVDNKLSNARLDELGIRTNELKVVYSNGRMTNTTTFDEIRGRAKL